MAFLRLLVLLLLTACVPICASALDNSFEQWTRACAALHNEGCSEHNIKPGPCTKVEKCLIYVCTKDNPGSCAGNSSLSWCDDIDCSLVSHLVRQATNPLGKLSGAANPRSIE